MTTSRGDLSTVFKAQEDIQPAPEVCKRSPLASAPETLVGAGKALNCTLPVDLGVGGASTRAVVGVGAPSASGDVSAVAIAAGAPPPSAGCTNILACLTEPAALPFATAAAEATSAPALPRGDMQGVSGSTD